MTSFRSRRLRFRRRASPLNTAIDDIMALSDDRPLIADKIVVDSHKAECSRAALLHDNIADPGFPRDCLADADVIMESKGASRPHAAGKRNGRQKATARRMAIGTET